MQTKEESQVLNSVYIQAMSSPSQIVSFLRICGKLKELKRTGWVRRNVARPESVADHMYRMAMCAFAVDSSSVDKSKTIKMAIVHDLAESLVGDITPMDGVAKEDKYRMEHEAMLKIKSTLGDSPIAQEIYELWQEYEEGQTAEALLVKDIDKFEMILQADDYETAQNLTLGEFFEGTKGCFVTDQIKSLDEELRRQRSARMESTTKADAS